MKSLKINTSKLLAIVLVSLSILALPGNGFAAHVRLSGGQLSVDGELFIIKGVNYNPIPIGIDPEADPPYGDYLTSNYRPIYERNLPLLKEMGVNTVRLPGWTNDADHTDFLDKAYNNGDKSIYVIVTFRIDATFYPDISTPVARSRLRADFRAMVAAYKNHPAVLMWSIGDELNSPEMYGDRLGDLFTLINELANQAHQEEGVGYHPVTTPLADIDLINTISTYEPLTTDLDIWAANIYRGPSFGELFSDLKKVSSRPVLITGFGIDAYDERAGDEYENVGTAYQAVYAESLWKEISANPDICLGGVITAYSDEWWLGKFGNTLGGCPDPDPALHSPCGHHSDFDPDGFVNYEWFGIMRVKKNDSGVDTLEPRKLYNTLKSLWAQEEGKAPSATAVKLPKVQPSFKPLDLSRPPTTEEIMAAGQLGGPLHPTDEIEDKEKEKKVNHSFGEAIQAWNDHDYKKAVKLFKKHLDDYPDSPWASEAVLHIGCEAQYNGRYSEAEESFLWILEKNKWKDHEGAKRLLNKARLRLGVLRVYQSDFKVAKSLFTTLKKEGSDWRDRTYASHWIQRLTRYTAGQLSMLNCGTQALAYMLEKEGRTADARRALEILPETPAGHSLRDLSGIASRFGYHLTAVKIAPSELKNLPLPAVMHLGGKEDRKERGHYWVLSEMIEDKLELYDPQARVRFEQTVDEFSKEWSGYALVFSDKEDLPGSRVAEGEAEEHFGGCCGVPAPESPLGDSCSRRSGPSSSPKKGPHGSPYWKVNMVNMNLYVNDIPLWYRSKRGPSVSISLSYNSQSAIAYNEPFGNKWMFNYGTYLTVDASGNVTIFMPDGRRDVYSKVPWGYDPPYQVFNTLTKIAENHYQLKFPNGSLYVYNIPPGSGSQQPFLVEIRDTHNQSLTFGYDTNVRLTTITDALQRVTSLTYNTEGLVTSVTDPFDRTASFEYDANRNLTRITDLAGYSSTLTYDDDVYLTSVDDQWGGWGFYIEPSDGITSSNYPPPGGDMWGNYRITITNPEGDKEEYYYSGDADYGWNSYYVSPKHYVAYESFSKKNYTYAPKTFYYLAWVSFSTEISKIVTPEGSSVSFSYDSSGNRTGIQDGNGNTTSLSYDAAGNVLTLTDPLGNSWQLTYDTNNNLTYLTDPAGNDYDLVYDGYDLIRVIDPKLGETLFSYNAYGQLTTLTDANDHSTTFGYDGMGNLTTVTNPLSGQDSYTYDSIGRVATHTDPKDNTTSYTRDGMGRITQVTYQDQSAKTYTYDCCRLSSVSDSNGTITIDYDSLKRPSTVTDVYGKTISLGYDKNHNVTTLTYPDSKVVTYEYDRADRLIKVTDWLSNATEYTFDSADNLIKTTYPNGYIITYEYDNGGRLKSILDTKPDGTVNAVYKYAFDQLANRTGISFSQPVVAIPSHTDTSYTYHDDNRMLTAGSTTFNYDNNGNLVTKTQGGNVTNYTWDFNDMLMQLTAGGNTYEYRYDGLRGRRARIENSVEKRYVFGLAETDASGNITAYYVYGLGLISKITPTNQAYYYHYDGIGSTVGISNSSGNMVNKYAYDAFGKVSNQEEAIPNPFKYVGRFGVMDEGNGLFYMRARYYDPEIGRFLNKDPIGFLGGDLNLYAYVANNPIRFIDPLGLEYVDLNFPYGFPFLLGITGGIMWNKEGISPYLGGGIMTPGLGGSLTWSPHDISSGVSVALQVALIIAGQAGYSFGKGCTAGSFFGEIGMGGGLPFAFSASLTGFYVFGPYSWAELDKALGLKPSRR